MIIKNRNSNAYAIMTGVILIAMLLMGFYVIMDPFARVYDTFTDNSQYIGYTTPEDCDNGGGNWDPETLLCKQLETKVEGLLERIRERWLFAPLVFILGIILWIYSQVTKKDYQQYQ